MLGRIMLTLVLLSITFDMGAFMPKVTRAAPNQSSAETRVRVGGELAVELDANPTTGYRWEIAEMDWGLLKQVGESAFRASSGAVGASGKTTFRFSALHAGEASIQFIYRRPWEATQIAEDSFEVRIRVVP